MKLTLEIAKTHLFSRFKQTAIATLGVTFGIGMFVGMISLMKGLNDFTEELGLITFPHIRIYNDLTVQKSSITQHENPTALTLVHHQKPKQEKLNLHNGLQIIHSIQQDKRVLGVSPQLITQVFYNYGPVQLNGSIYGVDILQEDKMFDIKGKMKSGDIRNLSTTTDGIIMGVGLAKKLNVKLNDRIKISTPEGYTLQLKIVGTFQIGIGAIDNVKSYANLSTVQKILQKPPNYITEINVKLKDITQSQQVAQEYQKMYAYQAEDWETANATNKVGNLIRDILTYSVSFTLLTVAGFGIYNILNMSIYSKMKDIAILKAMGFSGNDVMAIFLTQSIVIGLIGSILGLILGFMLAYGIYQIPFDAGDVIALDRMPVSFNPVYYIIGIIFGITTTTLAGYLPSRKAAKLDPIQIIRGQ